MLLCKVTGTVNAARRNLSAVGGSRLIVHPLDAIGDPEEVESLIAIDPGYGAHLDDFVIVAMEGTVVEELKGSASPSTKAMILGIVDYWSAEA